MAQIKITLVRSTIGAIPKHRKTVKALGLRKINSSVIREDIPSVRGMTNQISHLLKVENYENA